MEGKRYLETCAWCEQGVIPQNLELPPLSDSVGVARAGLAASPKLRRVCVCFLESFRVTITYRVCRNWSPVVNF